MKLQKSIQLLICSAVLIFTSCTKDSLDQKLFTPSTVNTEIKWTAYKYTNKVGVNGIFEEFRIEGLEYRAPIKQMLSDVSIAINTESLNTNSEFRDANIKEYFFRKLHNSDWIHGNVIKVTGGETSGKVTVMIDFNNVSNELDFDFKISGGNLFLEGDFELSKWQANSYLDGFDDCCTDYHTGEDGKLLLWPTVHLNIRTGMQISN